MIKLIEDDGVFIERSPEYDKMIAEAKTVAENLFDKHGPEISYEISKTLNKLISNDITQAWE